jgi:hypothetical protein
MAIFMHGKEEKESPEETQAESFPRGCKSSRRADRARSYEELGF